MNMFQSIKSCLSKYATFRGRASRSEFWWFTLIVPATLLVTMSLNIFTFMNEELLFYTELGSIIFAGLTVIPSAAVTVRRLHDVDKSGWRYLYIFIPFIGWFMLFVLLCREGSRDKNRFGKPIIFGEPKPKPEQSAEQ